MTTVDHGSFEFRGTAAGRALHSAALEMAPHLFTTKEMVGRGDSARGELSRLAAALDVAADDVVMVTQVHGRSVLVVERGEPVPEAASADAIVSTDPGRAICVRVADCVPILLADRTGRAVAAVHAGWRGTCAGVAVAAVQAFEDAAGVRPAELVAAIGPSIGPCCYQVDDRIRTTFLGMTPDAASWFAEDGPGYWRLDLWAANADQLESAGVPAAAIHQSRLCTFDRAGDFFSYRREGAGTGRMLAAIRCR
jgi:YfiH family protein